MAKQRPLYVYVPDEAHEYLKRVKEEYSLSYSDFVSLLLLYAENNFTNVDINKLKDELIFGKV